jgi:PadR family transcriptional regulator PadR
VKPTSGRVGGATLEKHDELTASRTLCRLASMGLRLSHQGLVILSYFLASEGTESTGADLIKETGLPSGTVYPILLRYERLKILESQWEDGNPKDLGRPRRRFYRLTGSGMALATSTLSKLTGLQHAPARG